MVLEAVMIVIDNSEFTRNGDYPTSRFDAQLDTVDLLFQSKINSNPETSVGLMASAGDGPQVLSTLTADYGKILSGLHETKIQGESHFATAIQVAALALKHRQNKVQHQRIVVFVASPVKESEKELEKLAKKMKKNSVAVDFINFGEESVNTSKLEKFISLVNNQDNSHLVTAPPGSRMLYEVVAASPIIIGEGQEGQDFGGAGGDFDFGGDAGMDPDLALALRLSLEEEQARQAREAQEAQQPTMETIEERDGNTNGEGENNNNNNEDSHMEDAR